MTEKEKETKGLSRRDFLKDAGLLVGGTAIGSTVLLAACGGGETETVTNTVTNTATVTSTVGAGQTATVTETQTATAARFVCPVDGMEFDTLTELQAHFEAEHAGGVAMPGLITLHVNGENHMVLVEPEWPLSFVLREKFGLMGLKVGCDRAECGTCTIIVDGRNVYACTLLAIECGGMDIQTIEGLADGPNLHPIQVAFRDNSGFNCGYCTPGMIMSTVVLLEKNPNPSMDEVKQALSGNLCYCGSYIRHAMAALAVQGGS